MEKNTSIGKFPSCNNGRFVQPLLPTFRYSFAIPVEFGKRMEEELKGRPAESVVLMTEEEPSRQWLVKIEGGRYFKQGWEEFCEEHSLQVGDFVVFSYQRNLVFYVAVFDHSTSCQRLFGSLKAKKSEVKYKFSDGGKISGKKRPSEPSLQNNLATCQITLSSYAFKRAIVYLPMHFIRSSGLASRRCEIKLVDSKNRTWKAKLLCRADGISYINQGLAPLQAANNFRPQDLISFQLIKSGNRPVLKCFRSSKTETSSEVKFNSSDGKNFGKKRPRKTQVQTKPSEDHCLPSCQITLTSLAINSSIVYLPRPFTRLSGLANKNCEIKVVDSKDRPWKAKIMCRAEGQSYINRTWEPIQAANNFKLQDVICFQLLKSGDRPVMKCFRISTKG